MKNIRRKKRAANVSPPFVAARIPETEEKRAFTCRYEPKSGTNAERIKEKPRDSSMPIKARRKRYADRTFLTAVKRASVLTGLIIALQLCAFSCARTEDNTEDSFEFSLSQTQLLLKEGEVAYVHLLKTPEDGKKIPLQWRAENEAVATVNNGRVLAVGEGETYIEVQTQEETLTCKIKVERRK